MESPLECIRLGQGRSFTEVIATIAIDEQSGVKPEV